MSPVLPSHNFCCLLLLTRKFELPMMTPTSTSFWSVSHLAELGNSVDDDDIQNCDVPWQITVNLTCMHVCVGDKGLILAETFNQWWH